MTVAALVDPAVERIYGDATHTVVVGEWNHLRELLDLGDCPATIERLGHDDYLVVASDGAPDEVLVALRLATTVGAFFGYDAPGRLSVVTTAEVPLLPSSILTIQRYRGKTNERFTRLLLTLALAAVGGTVAGSTASVFDPLAGRGTTLNAAVQRGLSAAGVEIDARDHRHHVDFLSNWLEDNRLKHRMQKSHVRDEDGTRLPNASFAYALTREDFKAGRTASVEVVAGDSLRADRWFARRSYDCLVTDLPYGVQHGAERGGAGGTTWSSPAELLGRGLPVWSQLLRPHASIACSWNLRTLERSDVLATLEANGFDVVGGDADSAFEHRVDHSIQRDLVVATRGA